MKKQFLVGAITASTLLVGVIAGAPSAQAATIACSSFTGFRLDASTRGIVPNAGCAVGSQGQDSIANVNADTFFDISTWGLLAKSDENSGKNFFTPPEDGTAGTFDFSALGIDFSKQNVLVTFKAANEFNFVGYLATAAAGSWTSPFTDFNNNGRARVRDVSHMSIFTSAKPDPTPVPTPALLPGLIGMGAAALRKRRGAAEESAEA
ncbi:PTPA-CTERM sorting domain-containing protein [Pseudanabaena sp. FACHB-2040]|uniref:PTPA-CTERM sorting domain-containing protein n=1 Tax=Pseudanabaena sp. FACHB-2040 TaxID=2692859 RepID=UPI001684E821|nr:PTPA-CTERM sorting domain-containing protein [Pseudanabaena sp. FACHB-2040]MBD2260609.1 PTPA-CTERM sorting domain-containing protein [Pseudanabaena sp. FACHB-2040]